MNASRTYRFTCAILLLTVAFLTGLLLGDTQPARGDNGHTYKVQLSGVVSEENLTRELNEFAKKGWKLVPADEVMGRLVLFLEKSD